MIVSHMFDDGARAFRGKVAAVASWDLFPFILNVERSGLTVNAGWMPFGGTPLTESQALLNRLMGRSVRDWENSRNDALTSQVALEHLRRDTPRVLYVGFGDTDEYAPTRASRRSGMSSRPTRSTAARPR